MSLLIDKGTADGCHDPSCCARAVNGPAFNDRRRDTRMFSCRKRGGRYLAHAAGARRSTMMAHWVIIVIWLMVNLLFARSVASFAPAVARAEPARYAALKSQSEALQHGLRWKNSPIEQG